MTSFVYEPAVYDGTNASLTGAISSAGDRFDMRALVVYTAVMSARPQDKNPNNDEDAMPSELNFSVRK